MKRSLVRKFLYGLLGLSIVFAAIAWLIPYDFRPDPAARFKIAAAQLKRDRSSYWLNLHLKRSGDEPHDLMKPVRLITADQRELEPADTTFAGEMGPGTTEIWLKFWLDQADVEGPLTLQINDGRLKVKSTTGLPSILDGAMRTFMTYRW